MAVISAGVRLMPLMLPTFAIALAICVAVPVRFVDVAKAPWPPAQFEV